MSWHAYAPRDSPPSHTLLGQNLDLRVFELQILKAVKYTVSDFRQNTNNRGTVNAKPLSVKKKAKSGIDKEGSFEI